jgi:cobalt-zinc-cadmium efflux system outer membrane protein
MRDLATTHPQKTDRQSVFWLVSLVLLWLALQPAVAHADGLDELQATARLCQRGAERAVARGQRLLGEALEADADVLPNPMVSASHDRTFSGEREHETTVGVQIPLGIGGGHFVRQDAAAAKRAQLELEGASTVFDSALAFRRAYARASLAAARLEAMRRQLAARERLLQRLERLGKAGESASYDVRRLRNDAELLRASATALDGEVRGQRAWLGAIAGTTVELSPAVDQLGGHAGAAGAADAPHPRVAVLEASARASALMASAARRRWVPDVDLFAGYLNQGGANRATGHGISVGISVPLVLFDHGQGEAQRAEAQHTLALARAERVKRDLRAQQVSARARLETLSPARAHLEDALVQAHALERDAERLYLAGEAPMLEVLEALRHVGALQQARIDLAERSANAKLDWIAARGRFSEALLSDACTRRSP